MRTIRRSSAREHEMIQGYDARIDWVKSAMMMNYYRPLLDMLSRQMMFEYSPIQIMISEPSMPPREWEGQPTDYHVYNVQDESLVNFIANGSTYIYQLGSDYSGGEPTHVARSGRVPTPDIFNIESREVTPIDIIQMLKGAIMTNTLQTYRVSIYNGDQKHKVTKDSVQYLQNSGWMGIHITEQSGKYTVYSKESDGTVKKRTSCSDSPPIFPVKVSEQRMIDDLNRIFSSKGSVEATVQFGSYMIEPPASITAKPMNMIKPKQWW